MLKRSLLLSALTLTCAGQVLAAVPPAGLGATAAPGATAPKKGEEVAVIKTNLGNIILKFFPGKAPNHVANFKALSRIGFYNGVKFHRVIPGFMIQGGDPFSKTPNRMVHGTGQPCFAKIPAGLAKVKRIDRKQGAQTCYNIAAEFNDIPHSRGILSTARAGDPNSAGSQFFITVANANFLDRQYTAMGQVVKGMDVADRIVNLPRDTRDNPLDQNPAIIKGISIVPWPVK